jgi:hypothetical protein
MSLLVSCLISDGSSVTWLQTTPSAKCLIGSLTSPPLQTKVKLAMLERKTSTE